MWLIESSVRRQLEQAHRAQLLPSAEQQTQYEARYYEEGGEPKSRLLSIAGDTAAIRIHGAVTKRPSFMAYMFGGGNCTYREIVAAIAEAEANAQVKNITLDIDSPGGHFDGLFDALAAIQSAKKPTLAVASGVCASAAYALGAACDRLEGTNKAVRFGSIGVAATFYVWDDEVDITSTNAPKKRPDVRTEEGQAVVREELDAMHDIFVDAIATGRKTTSSTVNAEFGQGATFLAGEALKRGMIDAVLDSAESAEPTPTTATSGNQQDAVMDLKTLQAQHPDVYAAAVAEGQAEERDRVTAHLIAGEASGDMKTAVEACQSGDAMTATLQAKYMTAGMNRTDVNNRQDDDAAASAADGAEGDDTQDEGDAVATAVESLVGAGGKGNV